MYMLDGVDGKEKRINGRQLQRKAKKRGKRDIVKYDTTENL